jgi:hypothetical protein
VGVEPAAAAMSAAPFVTPAPPAACRSFLHALALHSGVDADHGHFVAAYGIDTAAT